jgi:hypothetical protein
MGLIVEESTAVHDAPVYVQEEVHKLSNVLVWVFFQTDAISLPEPLVAALIKISLRLRN